VRKGEGVLGEDPLGSQNLHSKWNKYEVKKRKLVYLEAGNAVGGEDGEHAVVRVRAAAKDAL